MVKSEDTCFRLIVCGGRGYDNYHHVFTRLAEAMHTYPGLHVMQGGAKGADTLAKKACAAMHIPCTTYEALWETYGKGAGKERNWHMLLFGKPHAVLPFPGGSGTFHMVQIAHERKVPVWSCAQAIGKQFLSN